jgi:hypothetical protein
MMLASPYHPCYSLGHGHKFIGISINYRTISAAGVPLSLDQELKRRVAEPGGICQRRRAKYWQGNMAWSFHEIQRMAGGNVTPGGGIEYQRLAAALVEHDHRPN